jgi:hypothetical protein|nr:MAG TPA: Mitochondrial genome maintenance exonuclease 1, DNA complex, DNA exonuclease [Caudoviricetes sp.]
MDKSELKRSAVVFDPTAHTYTLGDKKLGGVTAIVKWLFPDTYKDIPAHILNAAAEHGSLVHAKCELYDAMGVGDDMEEVQGYIRLLTDAGLKTLESEYLVDDGAAIASSIDKVFEPDDNGLYTLGDIKCTSKIHVQNVTLQLSIYAALFEKNNRGKKVGKLYVIWLPKAQYGKPQLMELERIPKAACTAIMKAYLAGEDPTPLREKYFLEDDGLKEEPLPDDCTDMEQELANIEVSIKTLSERKDEIKAKLYERMVSDGVKKWTGGALVLTRKADSTQERVDSTKLKASYPDAFEACKKVVSVKGSLVVKAVEEEKN